MTLQMLMFLIPSAHAADLTGPATEPEPTDDLAIDDPGDGPDPGVEPRPPGDIVFDGGTDLDPADDVTSGGDGTGTLLLSAAAPTTLGAHLSAYRPMEWNADPDHPTVHHRIYPDDTYFGTTTLHFRAQPGYDYHAVFCVESADSFYLADASLRLRTWIDGQIWDSWGFWPSNDNPCNMWMTLSGPELGEEPDQRQVELGFEDLPGQMVDMWVTEVQLIAVPK